MTSNRSPPPREWCGWAALARSLTAGRWGPTGIGVALVASCGLNACQPNVNIGDWTCSPDGGASVIPDKTDPVAVPWSTGFENRFCDYTELASFCYANAPATYGLVTSPVHSGRFAAAFSVESADPVGFQTRCVRQGVLPTDAYYGAWYYIPAFATVSGNWNLLHFAGGDDLSTTGGVTGFLDVSLLSANGALQLALFGPNHVRLDNPPNTTPVPIGAWFRIQLRLKRAAGMTGEAALYQDGQQLCDATNVVTDSSSLGQWYVGNFANNSALTPLDSTLYVDDVTISNAL